MRPLLPGRDPAQSTAPSRTGRRLLALLVALLLASACGGSDDSPQAQPGLEPELQEPTEPTAATPTPMPTAPAPEDLEFQQLAVEVVNSFAHDTASFTQGLEFDADGRLFESSGSPGDTTSFLREVQSETGNVVRSVDIEEPLFAEGLTVLDDRIIVLTWTAERALVYDRSTFELIDEFTYEGEGWGLCHDGERFVMSNGTDQLTFRDTDTFAPLATVTVTFNGGPLAQINELECVAGQVWANIWLTDQIVRINPANGEVTGLVAAAGLLEPHPSTIESGSVLNGIAYIEETDTFLITGKRWPAMFEVRFVPAA